MLLTPEQWFFEGHGLTGGARNSEGIWMPTSAEEGSFIWAPPLAAAGVAMEELVKARHKRPYSTHLFVCPRVKTNAWRKRPYRTADSVFVVPVGVDHWETDMHEPLVVGICLPLARRSPWEVRRCPQILAMEGRLRRLWERKDGSERPLLRKLCQLSGEMGAVRASVVP